MHQADFTPTVSKRSAENSDVNISCVHFIEPEDILISNII